MNEEIRKIIQEKLPEETGKVLKNVLEKAHQDANKLKECLSVIEDKDRIIMEQTKNLDDYKKMDDRNANLDAREDAIKEREEKAEIYALQERLKAEVSKSEFMKEVAMGLVRNTEYRKQIFDSENQQGYSDGNGRWVQPSPVDKSFKEEGTAL